MKITVLLIAFFAAVLLSSCGKKGKARERAAAQRVEKDLTAVLAEKGLKLGSPIFIRAFKEEKTLELFVRNESTGKFELLRSYPIVAASGELGPKLSEGDGQVP